MSETDRYLGNMGTPQPWRGVNPDQRSTREALHAILHMAHFVGLDAGPLPVSFGARRGDEGPNVCTHPAIACPLSYRGSEAFHGDIEVAWARSEGSLRPPNGKWSNGEHEMVRR